MRLPRPSKLAALHVSPVCLCLPRVSPLWHTSCGRLFRGSSCPPPAEDPRPEGPRHRSEPPPPSIYHSLSRPLPVPPDCPPQTASPLWAALTQPLLSSTVCWARSGGPSQYISHRLLGRAGLGTERRRAPDGELYTRAEAAHSPWPLRSAPIGIHRHPIGILARRVAPHDAGSPSTHVPAAVHQLLWEHSCLGCGCEARD